ncbi:RES family NAD+ phosphorylase [Rhodococcus sp. G-MC3]|uniref:RES family NAD+ phosphorylase n=1 Tax=Rhodococcus sp. G-MC3 TaxID=3046209 RepID=UPI0024BAD13D|nr:RES family NAD+ phosphorylase [Rhodococcus sp. G-MC3]MDJ0396556.1 RES family NAD+ phosphorylase [Rhodococcus sp. G-MC3]
MGRFVRAQSNPMLPDPPSPQQLRELGIQDNELRSISSEEVWWRVHKTGGDHVLAWNELRTYGPLLRFDPHALPCGDDPMGRSVWYGASTPDVALAEAFQVDRTIDRECDGPYLTGLSFTRSITVLDVATDSVGAWATRVGGNFAMSTGQHAVTQHWARRIVEAFPDLGGLRYNSRFAGGPCLALFTPAGASMPVRPVLSLPLTHPDLSSRITGAAKRVGYVVV